MKTAVRLLSAAAVAVLLAACGGGSTEGSTEGGDTPGPAPDAGIQVVATGSWNDVGLGSKSWGWGVLLENPTGEAVRVDMDVNALNAAGEVIDTMMAMWTVVVAEGQGGISGAFFGDGDERIGSGTQRGVGDGFARRWRISHGRRRGSPGTSSSSRPRHI